MHAWWPVSNKTKHGCSLCLFSSAGVGSCAASGPHVFGRYSIDGMGFCVRPAVYVGRRGHTRKEGSCDENDIRCMLSRRRVCEVPNARGRTPEQLIMVRDICDSLRHGFSCLSYHLLLPLPLIPYMYINVNVNVRATSPKRTKYIQLDNQALSIGGHENREINLHTRIAILILECTLMARHYLLCQRACGSRNMAS